MTADCPYAFKILQLSLFFSSSPITTTTKKLNLNYHAIWWQLIISSESLSADVIITGQEILSELILKCVAQQSCFSARSVSAIHISNLVRLNYRVSLYLRGKAPNKLNYIHIQIKEVVRARNLFHST